MCNVKITEEFDLEQDPKVSCRNYANAHGYSEVQTFNQIWEYFLYLTKIFQCLDDEYLSQALKAMNCSPPYLTNKQQFWCKEDIDIEDMNVLRFLWKLGGGVLDDGKCLPPCQKTKYESILHCIIIYIIVKLGSCSSLLKSLISTLKVSIQKQKEQSWHSTAHPPPITF